MIFTSQHHLIIRAACTLFAFGLVQNLTLHHVQSQDGEAEFQAKLEEWRQIIIDVQVVKLECTLAETIEKSAELREKYQQLRKTGDEKIDELKRAAAKAFREKPRRGTVYFDFLRNSLRMDLEIREDMVSALIMAEALDTKPISEPDIAQMVGVTMYYHQKFDRAEKLLKYSQSRNSDRDFSNELKLIPRLKASWERELKLRDKDLKAKLPRAIVETTKGTIVFELFEDEAPNTVRNFVSLAEQEYYNGLEFFDALPFKRTITGSQSNNLDVTGRRIANEGLDPDKRRDNFRGTLSAIALKDLGLVDGGLILISFAPNTQGKPGSYCNFGRVLTGFDVLDKLNRHEDIKGEEIEDFKADKIVKITIENKREHDYKPVFPEDR